MPDYQPFDASFDTLVDKALQQWHVPGLSLAVVNKGTSHFQSYGQACLDPPTPAASTTLYHTASLTKAQLCTVWALYIASPINQAKPEAERITWRTPMAQLLPDDFVLSDPGRTAAVTLEDALCHRTGCARHDPAYAHPDIQTPRTVTRNLRTLPLDFDLRTDFAYCNVMFIAATYALEVVSGNSFATLLREMLWRPLSMHSTYAAAREAQEAAQEGTKVPATRYTWSQPSDGNDDSPWTAQPQRDLTRLSGAGFVVSTTEDYAKWMHALLSATSDSPLPANIVDDLWTARMIVHDESRKIPYDGLLAYGLGWFISTYHGHLLYWHTGAMKGTGSYILLVPGLQWGVTYFANGDEVARSLRGLAFELLDARLGIAQQERRGFETVERSYIEKLRKKSESEKPVPT